MLKLVRCGFGSGVGHRIKDGLTLAIQNKKQSFLIVPEQQTVMAESEMAKCLPKNAPLYFEATNFTRFADTVFRSIGGLSGEFCDSGKRALIMWRAITELSPLLSMTSRGEVSAGLVDQALRAVAEMENLGISAEELAASANLISDDKRLSAKLSDLSKIYSLYKTMISERYADTNDSIKATINKLREKTEYLRGVDIYIDGFTSFTEAQYSLIGILAARTSVTVFLPIPKGEREGFEHREIQKAQRRLVNSAKREGAEVSLSREGGNINTTSELLAELPYAIWKVNPIFENITLQKDDELRIFEASTPFEECDFIASDIRRRVMGGAKFSDFAIVARSAEKYTGILDGALSGADIPHFFSTKTDVSSLEAIKLIYTAFAIIRNGFRREDVITYAKCGFSGISREECDELEIYCNVWQINGTRFTDGIDWNMNPRGYTQKRSDDVGEKLSRLNDIKHRLISPLLALKEDMSEKNTVREGALALMKFLLEIRMEHRLKASVDRLRSIGDTKAAGEISGVWKMIISSLDSMVEVMGDLPCTMDSFLSQLKAVLSYANLGKIPAFVDQVTVGSADMLRLSGKRHVYLIGVNTGEFPGAVSESSFFSDSDRLALSRTGLDIEPELEVKNARELFCFSRAMASASDSVTLLYSQTDTKFKRISRADVIDKIIKLTAGKVTPRRISDMSAKERLYSASDTVNSLDTIGEREYTEVREALINSGWGDIVAISEGDIKNTRMELSEAMADEIYGKSMALTQSRLDSFVSCPMGHFLRYTVKLTQSKRAEFDAPSIGSFIHGCLENFFTSLRERKIEPSSLDRIEREKLTRAAAEKYLSIMGEDIKSTRTAVKIKRLTRAAVPIIDGLCDEFAKTKFKPRFFELEIRGDDEGAPDPIKLKCDDKRSVYVYGIIDRVDTYEEDGNVFVRVIDYKTGVKEFNPEDIEKGRNLQMFLYLKAILESDKKEFLKRLGVSEGGKIIPAGVIYVKTSLSDVEIDRDSDELALSAVKKNQLREGMALEGDTVDMLLGKDYVPGANKRECEKFRYSEEEFSEIMEKVEGSVVRIAEKIRSGKAEAYPDLDGQFSPCDLCEYKPVCRNVKSKK